MALTTCTKLAEAERARARRAKAGAGQGRAGWPNFEEGRGTFPPRNARLGDHPLVTASTLPPPDQYPPNLSTSPALPPLGPFCELTHPIQLSPNFFSSFFSCILPAILPFS
ncbi:hypothetical protein DM02DRAFT_615570 [Periconia macrospinosa]|uniref:Uncharacterized protein n=1 Tax=Periconia macrospinosa TaxID=97972 RepID=A0A2V1DLL3_9PLEO|nr:hypothetical protein DM02DRAFT_615570 [Periconia macrospinosa]